MDTIPAFPKERLKASLGAHFISPAQRNIHTALSESVLQLLAHTFQKAWAEDIQGLLLSLQCMEELSICSPHESLHCAKILGVFEYAVGKTQSKLNISLPNCWYM